MTSFLDRDRRGTGGVDLRCAMRYAMLVHMLHKCNLCTINKSGTSTRACTRTHFKVCRVGTGDLRTTL